MDKFKHSTTHFLDCIIAVNQHGNWIVLSHDKTKNNGCDHERIIEILYDNEQEQDFIIKNKKPRVYFCTFQITESIENTNFTFKDEIFNLKTLLEIDRKNIIIRKYFSLDYQLTIKYGNK